MAPKKYEFIWDTETLEEAAIRICENEGIEYCHIGVTLCTRQDDTWYPVLWEKTGIYYDGDQLVYAIIYC